MFVSPAVCLLLHQACCQTQLQYRLSTKPAIPETAGPGQHPKAAVCMQTASKAAVLAEILKGYLQALRTSEQCAGWVTDTESLFQLTTCFQNLDRVY